MLTDQNRYRVLYTPGTPMSFKINLTMGDIDYVDFKEDIENLLSGEKEKSINAVTDSDIIRYKPAGSTTTLTFRYNGSSQYTSAGFTSSEISNLADVFVNSGYVIQVYDKTDSTSQTLLHTGHINGYQILTNTSSVHSISLTSESFAIYLPQLFLDSITSNTFTLYFRFFFYRAKDGALIPFTQNVTPLTNEAQQYFSMVFTKNTKKYAFPSSLTIIQLPSSQYTTNINNTVESIRLEKPVYPAGNTFSTDGSYSQID